MYPVSEERQPGNRICFFRACEREWWPGEAMRACETMLLPRLGRWSLESAPGVRALLSVACLLVFLFVCLTVCLSGLGEV